MSGRDALTQFLRDQAAAPAADPEIRCGAMVAAWFVTATGRALPPVDPAQGLYRALCRACAALGLEATETPRRGDVAVIRAGDSLMGAVCLGQRWAARSAQGVVVLSASSVLRAWKVA